MRPAPIALLLILAPAPVRAHDAFGDLGPFFGSLLHPLADPLQAALLAGTAAYLAGRRLDAVRRALPVFAAALVSAQVALALVPEVEVPTLLVAATALLIGAAAIVPDQSLPRWFGLILVAVAGALAGLAPGALPQASALQSFFGNLLGVAMLTILLWSAFDAAARRLSPLAPRVVGSWVAAIAIIVGAFAI